MAKSYKRTIIREYCDAVVCKWEDGQGRYTDLVKTGTLDNMEIEWRMMAPSADEGDCYRFAFPMRHIPDRNGDEVVWCYPQKPQWMWTLCDNIRHDHLLEHGLFYWGKLI